jgi:hypothetical protein
VALEALRQASPVGLRHGPQATWQQRDSAWAGSVGQGVDTCGHRTLPHARVSPVPGPCYGPDLTRRDLGPVRGTHHTFLGVPDCNQGPSLVEQGSEVPLWRSGPMTHPGCNIFPCHVGSLDLPMWWVSFSTRRLYTVVAGTPNPGYRQYISLGFS